MINTSLSEWEQDNIKILTSRQMGAWLGRRDNRLLDKIRAEIVHLHDWAFSREEILRIIDKYKAESEE